MSAIEQLTHPLQRAAKDVPEALAKAALRDILQHPSFTKAPRMCQLLTFLVTKKLAGAERDINEYAIGLEVFGRDAGIYNTGEDPLVRVQVGRLRERLNVYYASLARAPAVTIIIPLGNYVPLLEAVGRARPAAAQLPELLLVTPLRHIGAGAGCAPFLDGLNNELSTRLFAAAGGRMRLSDETGAEAPAAPAFRLEGSIQLERDRVRASVRLIDGADAHIAWLSRFDRCGPLDMSLQDGLAADICAGLSGHLWPAAGAAAP